MAFNVGLQCIPAISTNTPIATGIPTLFIIFLGMGKELYLEIKRWKEDKRINTAPCNILTQVDEQGNFTFTET